MTTKKRCLIFFTFHVFTFQRKIQPYRRIDVKKKDRVPVWCGSRDRQNLSVQQAHRIYEQRSSLGAMWPERLSIRGRKPASLPVGRIPVQGLPGIVVHGGFYRGLKSTGSVFIPESLSPPPASVFRILFFNVCGWLRGIIFPYVPFLIVSLCSTIVHIVASVTKNWPISWFWWKFT